MRKSTLPMIFALWSAYATSVFGQTVTVAPDAVTTQGGSNVVLTVSPAPTEEARKLTNTRRVTVGGVNAAFFATGDAGRLSFVAPPQDSTGDRDVRVLGDNGLELAAGRLRYTESATSGLQSVAMLVTWIAGLVVAAFAVVVLVLILIGRIPLDGLLNDDKGKPSLARFQFLVFTFVIALGLFIIVLNSNPPGFPAEIPNGILILLGLSGTGFLGAKGIEMLRAKHERGQ